MCYATSHHSLRFLSSVHTTQDDILGRGRQWCKYNTSCSCETLKQQCYAFGQPTLITENMHYQFGSSGFHLLLFYCNSIGHLSLKEIWWVPPLKYFQQYSLQWWRANGLLPSPPLWPGNSVPWHRDRHSARRGRRGPSAASITPHNDRHGHRYCKCVIICRKHHFWPTKFQCIPSLMYIQGILAQLKPPCTRSF